MVEQWVLYYILMECEKAAIFIDGGYLTKILKRQFNNSSLDYLAFSEKICVDLNLKRLRTYVKIADAENHAL